MNLGLLDRLIRLCVGSAMLASFFLVSGNGHWLGLLGIFPVITASLAWSPLYDLFGLDSGLKRKPELSNQGSSLIKGNTVTSVPPK